MLQASAPNEHLAGCWTLHVPNAHRARSDLTAIIKDHIVIATIIIDAISINQLNGFTHFGCLIMTRLKSVFLTSSLKPVSHFCRVTFRPTQPRDLLKTFQYLLPISRLKILRMATKMPMIHSIIKAATHTIRIIVSYDFATRDQSLDIYTHQLCKLNSYQYIFLLFYKLLTCVVLEKVDQSI